MKKYVLLLVCSRLCKCYEKCKSISVHEETKDDEGYGNQMHGMFLATTIAHVCNLTLMLPNEGRIGVVCSRLGCHGAQLGTNADMTRYGDIHVRYLPKLNVRCTITRFLPCDLPDPGCLAKLNAQGHRERDDIRAFALQQVFFNKGYNSFQPLPVTCTDGLPPPDQYDVTVHFRAITDQFEHKKGTTRLVQFVNASTTVQSLPPFADLVTPLTDYMTEKQLSKRIFLAANLPLVRSHLVQRFQEEGYAVCGLLHVNDTYIRHVTTQKIPIHGNEVQQTVTGPCQSCIDITFSEWDYLTRVQHFVAQMGMHCLENDCIDPSKRKYGWRSSFSYTAATYANVPVVFLTGAPVTDASLTPSSACRAQNTFVKKMRNDKMSPRFKSGPDENRAKTWYVPQPLSLSSSASI
mmetsp:Transcript_18537/g.27918  ORF Transcript_18537/g.27918 Transcript_18537/m.27918 type:complete len:406 (-) Transcript_18537:178-1395(-)